MNPTRGTFPVEFELPWRLDGAATDPTAPLVLTLHGQGMSEDIFAILVQKLFALPCRFLLPRAPWPFEPGRERRIGWSWYPYDGDQGRFLRDLARTEAMLLGLLQHVETTQGLRPRTRIVLGFSQGGYCAGVLALRHPEFFGGLVVAGARVKSEVLGEEIPAAAARGFRVLLCHGRRDPYVPLGAAASSRDALAAGGVPVELHEFDSGHSLGRAQVATIAAWLTRHFVPPGD
jgi:phospholipase/carboxylesterase